MSRQAIKARRRKPVRSSHRSAHKQQRAAVAAAALAVAAGPSSCSTHHAVQPIVKRRRCRPGAAARRRRRDVDCQPRRQRRLPPAQQLAHALAAQLRLPDLWRGRHWHSTHLGGRGIQQRLSHLQEGRQAGKRGEMGGRRQGSEAGCSTACPKGEAPAGHAALFAESLLCCWRRECHRCCKGATCAALGVVYSTTCCMRTVLSPSNVTSMFMSFSRGPMRLTDRKPMPARGHKWHMDAEGRLHKEVEVKPCTSDSSQWQLTLARLPNAKAVARISPPQHSRQSCRMRTRCQVAAALSPLDMMCTCLPASGPPCSQAARQAGRRR